MIPELAQLREFARRYTAAWCSHNPTRVADFYSTDGSLTINGGTPAVGRASIIRAAQEFMDAFPDLQVLMDDVVVQAPVVRYHWTLIGTNTGPGGTGQRVRISGFEEWELGPDSLIARSQGSFDSAEYQRQIEHGFQD